MNSLHQAIEFGRLASDYQAMRAKHPGVPAKVVFAYLKSDGNERFEEFVCPGHEWVYTGSAYGGDDETYHGEGRCYCAHCGADGDA